MFDLRKIQLSDRDRANAALAVSDFRGCEYSFANNMAWHRLADTVITFDGDFYISCSFYDGEPVFIFPAGVPLDGQGRDRYLELFGRLERFVSEQGHLFRVCSVTKENLGWLTEEFPKAEVSFDRGGFDYIYDTESFISLAGKRFHGKRGHIKSFKQHDWYCDELSAEDFDECALFAAGSYSPDAFSAAVEQYAIHTYFSNYEALGLKGLKLYFEGELAGFTIGERLNSDTFVVHIEKARADIRGAYPTLANEFARRYASGFKFINREEDLGIEGLRRSKQSYCPVELLEKHTLTFPGGSFG